uniref:CPG4 domain-containing protein n=1 Tax=Heterorhabditis bacteriophora TaxID=37862 RepID=A0A1I7X6I9_HETBA
MIDGFIMHQMQQEITDPSTEWSVDMVTPLQALLSGNTKRGRLAIRIDRVCKSVPYNLIFLFLYSITIFFRLNTVYQKCISICPENPAKRILINGQLAWNIICSDFKNDTEFRSIVVPCWSDYGSEISSKCSSLAQFFQTEIIQMMESGLENIQEGIDNLCRSVHSYDKCFVWQNYEYCGINAGKFLVKLTHQTSQLVLVF